ncbi:MAG TPA: hypothetical protein VK465_13760, partial [Fibrobacteria bacterium]|nr:hypothetical protein [Fibrobacteria bacterium]
AQEAPMKPVSRPIHSSDPIPAHARKASTSQAGGAAEGSSSPKVVSGMKPKEEKLAGYLMARTATNQKVEGRDLENLRVGNGSVRQVRDSLSLGRANVIEDIEKSKKSLIPLRNKASKEVAVGLMRELGEWTNTDFYRGYAAAALHAKTGSCGHFAAITNPLQASKLIHMKEEGAIVAQAHDKARDHGWVEMMPKGMREDGTPILHEKDVVMDGWSKEHLAVLREDSEFARLDQDGKADHLTHVDILDRGTGQDALRAVLGFKARIDGSVVLQGTFRKAVKNLAAEKFQPPRNLLWNDTSIFHADFRERAGKAVHPEAPAPREGAGHEADQAKRATLPEIQAVGVARSMGSNIRGAVAEAPGIIASAKDMFPDPR